MFGFLWLVLSLNCGQNFLEMGITDHVLSILIILLAKVVVLLLPGLAATEDMSQTFIVIYTLAIAHLYIQSLIQVHIFKSCQKFPTITLHCN